MRARFVCLALFAIASDAAELRIEREVIPARVGGNRLAPDVAVLSHAAPLKCSTQRDSVGSIVASCTGGLEDLRLYDQSNREIAYLLLSPESSEREWVAGRVRPIAQTKKASGFEIDLGKPLLVDRVRLERGLPPPFLKRYQLEGSGDRSRWTLLVAEGTLFDLPDERLKQREMVFAPGEFRYLRVTWDDRSSGRLPLPPDASARRAGSHPVVATMRIPLEMRSIPSEPGKSRYRLRLPGARLPVIAIEIDAAGGHIMRPARVTEARFVSREVRPHTLGTRTLRREIRGDLTAADLRIPIEIPTGEEVELVIDDGDNRRLELKGAYGHLAPLPSIYFESDSMAPLLARYGNRSVKAPRYDLEAVRDRVRRAKLPDARWGSVRGTSKGEVPKRADIASVGAAIDRSAFRFARAIETKGEGLNSLQLDAEVLASSPNLGDLRIIDDAGRQIPYIVERREEPLVLTLPKLQPTVRDGRETEYALRIPYASLPDPTLVLETGAQVFDRTIRVIQPPRGRDSSAKLVTQVRWRNIDPERAAPALALRLPSAHLDTLSIRVDEGDNAPLTITSARVLLPSYRLRFFQTGEGKLTLLYGASLRAPRYDLSLLAPRLVGEAAHEASLVGKATSAPDGARPQRAIFWSAIALAALVMLGIIAKLLRGA